MIKFIEKHNILYIHQFGFRHDFSTTLALIDTIDEIKSHLDKGEYVVGIFLDIKKAFDSINHIILLQKLDNYGFRGHSQKFLQSYLQNRQQYTIINEKKSNTLPVHCGVPQGSVLGPLLFLLYINDIQYAIQDAKMRLFADDTSLLTFDKNIDNLMKKSQQNMLQIQNWFIVNKLSLSLNKSNFIIFHNKKRKKLDHIQNIKIHNDSISRVQHTKYIGLILDENLNWDHHINEVCSSLTRYFSIFYNIRHFINYDLARIIYNACIYSKVKYGIEIYGSASKNRISKIQTLQNKLLRLLMRKDRMYSSNQLHKDLNILNITDIFKTTVLSFVHNCIKGNPIPVFQNYYQDREGVHQHYTRNRQQLQTDRFRTNMGKSTTHYNGAILWNNLGNDLTSIADRYEFRREISKLYKSYY